MSLSLTVLILAVWSLAMWRYARSLLFPPATLAVVWTLTMLTIYVCGDIYYPLTYYANEIVLMGVAAFTVGGLCAVTIPLWHGKTLDQVSAIRRRQIDGWLNAAVVLMVVNIPLSYLHLKELSSTIAPRESSWKQIRIASNKANITGVSGFSLESCMLPFLSIAALVAVYEYARSGRRPRRTLLLVLMSAGYQLLNGARSEVLLLLISSVVILWLVRGAAPLRLLTVVALLFAGVFGLGQISMNKYGAASGATLASNLPRVAEGFGTYWLGGIIAFDQNRLNPELHYGWDLGKFAKRIANRFGANYSERDRNLEYTKISPTQITNVYTVFLPYYMDHGGMAGVFGLMFLVGLLSTWVYRSAIHGHAWAVFTLGAFVYATVMTIFSEEYFAQITFWLKAGALSSLVYFTPGLTRTRYRSALRAHDDVGNNDNDELQPCA